MVVVKQKCEAARIDAVDLFCGGGGLTCGLRLAGINVKMGVEIDPLCRYTISKPARIEIFKHLSVLNRQRWEEEESTGLHKKGKK